MDILTLGREVQFSQICRNSSGNREMVKTRRAMKYILANAYIALKDSWQKYRLRVIQVRAQEGAGESPEITPIVPEKRNIIRKGIQLKHEYIITGSFLRL